MSVIQVRVTRFYYFAIVSLFAVLSTLAPDALGQLSKVTYRVVFDTLSLLEDQEPVNLSLGTQKPNDCMSLATGLDDRPTQALSPVLLLSDIYSIEQIKAPPECVLATDYTEQQKRRWDECKKELPCDSPHECSNENGDKFASCKKKYCSLIKGNKIKATSQ